MGCSVVRIGLPGWRPRLPSPVVGRTAFHRSSTAAKSRMRAETRLAASRWSTETGVDDLASIGDDWRGLAKRLGVFFLDRIAPERRSEESDLPHPAVFVRAESLLLGDAAEAFLVAAPRGEKRRVTAEMLAVHPELGTRLAIASPREIRRALIETHADALDLGARRRLSRLDPRASAERAPSAWQVLVLVLALDVWLISVLHLVATAVMITTGFFLVVGLFRAWIADDPLSDPSHPPVTDGDLPSFAVLVPLYREAAIVGDVVAALLALDYPRHLLQLRLVVEADDIETLAVATKAVATLDVDVVVVKPSLPRTKPKALNFALATVDAAFVAVFDAEDRPAPDQLRLAAAAFAAGPPRLAVVQAALDIDHGEADRSWWVRQFEIEYAVLFRGLLPWLSRRHLFFPLGGTSNHFRRAALDEVGAWDPFNVTEDVDVALRLARAGWSMTTIASTTLEEAPTTWSAWRAQRTRWLKGWLQTWFVHMRSPRRLHRELGLRDAAVFHLVVTGQLASAFVFAPSLPFLAWDLIGAVAFGGAGRFFDDVVLLAGLAAFSTGVLGGLAAAVRIAGRRRRLRLGDVLSIPLYWCALSVAAAQAVVELVSAPGRWNKTTHGRVLRSSDAPGRDDAEKP